MNRKLSRVPRTLSMESAGSLTCPIMWAASVDFAESVGRCRQPPTRLDQPARWLGRAISFLGWLRRRPGCVAIVDDGLKGPPPVSALINADDDYSASLKLLSNMATQEAHLT